MTHPERIARALVPPSRDPDRITPSSLGSVPQWRLYEDTARRVAAALERDGVLVVRADA